MAALSLTRPSRPRALISLVPMIDVMLILLVFFMVTSTYLNLDMIPAVRPEQGGAAALDDDDEDAGGELQQPAGELFGGAVADADADAEKKAD